MTQNLNPKWIEVYIPVKLMSPRMNVIAAPISRFEIAILGGLAKKCKVEQGFKPQTKLGNVYIFNTET